MSKKLREHKARKDALVKEARAITERAAADNRDMTDEEVVQFDAITAKIGATNAAIEREQLLASEERDLGYATIQDGHMSMTDMRETDKKRGFQSFGEFAQTVRNATRPGQAMDERLLIGAAAPGTYGGEGVGQDGGFAVPPEYANDIYTLSQQDDALLPYTDQNDIASNSMVYPKDETVPWGTDGVRAYWQSEATAANATKPKIGNTTMRLNKLMALVPLTDELLADQNALQSYLPGKVADSIRWKSNEAILFGAGNGTPIGAFNSNAVVTVVKESGQATLTLVPANLAKMVARLPVGSFGRSVWLINNDVLPALFTLSLGNYPIYLPVQGSAGGIQGSPYGMLLGRPVMVSQHAATFSAQGDVLLGDMSYYRTITKAGGIQTATSMHLYFDADATAFRATFRLDGQPKILNPINPAKGSTTMSPFVQLGAR